MIVFPNAKINIGLRITGKRNDGFHNLQTIFLPVALYDALEIIPDRNNNQNSFVQTGIVIDGKNTDNLVVKAVEIIRQNYSAVPAVKIHLHKAIPVGAGLGGGSSDAAFALKLMNQLFQLKIDSSTLEKYALQLGSDCPFFINNKTAAATGRGEVLKEVAINLHNYHLLLIHPGIPINTGWAFSQINSYSQEINFNNSIPPLAEWQEFFSNDFEVPVFKAFPVLQEIKEKLYENGALFAAMSGTGSVVYGIFKNKPSLLTLPENCKQYLL